MCGDILNRGQIVLTLVFVPMALVLFFIPYILEAVYVDETAAYYAGVYTRNMLFGLFMQSQFDLYRKFLIMLG